MTGRPPSTVDGQLKALMRRLDGPGGAMSHTDRLDVILNATASLHYNVRHGMKPDRSVLVQLAGHALAWAKDVES